MKTLVPAGLFGGALIVLCQSLATAAHAADAAHGREIFQTQCGICHMAGEGDGEGAVGPNLRGVVGRKVGGDPNFNYSDALQNDKGVWTLDSLATFLADPQKAKPGTPMPIKLDDAKDRADVAAYLASVKAEP